MKLYYAPGACSLADHIALREAGITPDLVKTDLRARSTEEGENFDAVNPKGYVPALVLDGGELLTENVAILAWTAEKKPELAPQGALGRIRLLEMLSFINGEIHKQFGAVMFPTSDKGKELASNKIDKRLNYLADTLNKPFLFGEQASAADAYLYVMLRWAESCKLPVPQRLQEFRAAMEKRPAVREALAAEGLA